MADEPTGTFGAYARHRGCSRQAVSRAWKGGRLKASVLMVDGRPTIPDFAAADAEWTSNTDHRRHPVLFSADGPETAPIDGEKAERGEYAGAAAREKHWRAQLAELQYKQRAGELVNAKEMAEAMAADYSTVRTKLLGVPSKAKQALPHLTLEDLATLDDIVREALDALAPEANA